MVMIMMMMMGAVVKFVSHFIAGEIATLGANTCLLIDL